MAGSYTNLQYHVVFSTKNRKPIVRDQCFGRYPDSDHLQNWIDCIRSREKPNADIEIGMTSHSSLLYATMSYQIGGIALNVDPKTKHVDNAEAMTFFKRKYRKPWTVPEDV